MVDGIHSSLPLARWLSRRIGSTRVAEYPEIHATLGLRPSVPWIPTILVFTEWLSPRSRRRRLWIVYSCTRGRGYMVGVADQPLYCGSTVGAGKFTGQALAAFSLVLLRLDPEARARSLIVRVTLREELPIRLQCQGHRSVKHPPPRFGRGPSMSPANRRRCCPFRCRPSPCAVPSAPFVPRGWRGRPRTPPTATSPPS